MQLSTWPSLRWKNIYTAICKEKYKQLPGNVTIAMPTFHSQEVKYFNKHVTPWCLSTQAVPTCWLQDRKRCPQLPCLNSGLDTRQTRKVWPLTVTTLLCKPGKLLIPGSVNSNISTECGQLPFSKHSESLTELFLRKNVSDSAHLRLLTLNHEHDSVPVFQPYVELRRPTSCLRRAAHF